MGRSCSTNEKKRNTYRLLVGKPERRDYYEDQYAGVWII
jgi:hypothetical protein